MSIAQGTGTQNRNYGSKRSKEAREKMSNSQKIYNKTHPDRQIGKKNPSWKGGISFEPYCQKFTKEFKERVRAFFGYQCQECGHVWQLGETRLAVHHVNFRKDSCCNENLIPLFVPLCSGNCHSKTNGNRPFWEYWFTEMINHLYKGRCYFTKEEMMKDVW
jgi:5-methylcytosine-specific restriction endonuclease McrA